MGWQKRSGYTRRALVETAISRLKRVIGDALRSRRDGRRATEVAIAIAALNRMLELDARSRTSSPKLKAWDGRVRRLTNRFAQHGTSLPFRQASARNSVPLPIRDMPSSRRYPGSTAQVRIDARSRARNTVTVTVV